MARLRRRERGKVSLSLIPHPGARKERFHKRRKGFMKKLHELTTLCDVKACAIIGDPFSPNLHVWPSIEVAQEVVSEFTELPETERTRKMVDHEAYLRDMIRRGEVRVEKLRAENRKSQLREYMVDCLKKKMMLDNCDAGTIKGLGNVVDKYIKELTFRIQTLTGDGEGSSSPVADATPLVVTDTAAMPVATPTGFSDHFQYHNMMNHRPVQYHAHVAANMVPPAIPDATPLATVTAISAFRNNIQYPNMNMIHNQYEPFQYQAYGPPPAANRVSPAVPNATPRVVTNADRVSTPFGFSHHFHYHNNMIMNSNQYQSVQYYAQVSRAANMVPPGFPVQNQAIVQYQAPAPFYDQTQHMNYGMNLNQNMNLDLNQNQYPNQQQMDNVGGHRSIPIIDPNTYRYHHRW